MVWDELDLKRKTEKALKECKIKSQNLIISLVKDQKLLLEYEMTFSNSKKSSEDLEKAVKTKKIEKPIKEEDKNEYVKLEHVSKSNQKTNNKDSESLFEKGKKKIIDVSEDSKEEEEDRKIIINLVLKDSSIRYDFSDNFTIYRNKSLKNNICLDDQVVSREHAHVIFLLEKGYFLQDRGSSNHTYIRVFENTEVHLYEGMEILIGNSTFKILEIEKGRVTIEANLNYILNFAEKKKIHLKFKERLFFGSDPSSADPNDELYKFENDPKIEKNQVIFHYIQGNVRIEAMKSKMGFELKCVHIRKFNS